MPVTPAFPPAIFESRRAEVLRRMRELTPGPSVAVFPATPVATRNHDVDHPYRAESDLFWLTGFEEPEAVAVLSTEGAPLTLFVRPRDRDREIWNGRRAGVEGAKAAFGASQAFRHQVDSQDPVTQMMRDARGHIPDRAEAQHGHRSTVGNVGVRHRLPGRRKDVGQIHESRVRRSLRHFDVGELRLRHA